MAYQRTQVLIHSFPRERAGSRLETIRVQGDGIGSGSMRESGMLAGGTKEQGHSMEGCGSGHLPMAGS